MAEDAEPSPIQLHVDFTTSLVVPMVEDFGEYYDNYLRRFSGTIEIVGDEGEEQAGIGEIHVLRIDGEGAAEKELDIVDICDSLGQDEYEYAESLYTDGEIEHSIVEDPISQDALVLHRIAILPAYRGKGYGLSVTEKIIETMGSQCGAILLRPAPLQFSAQADDAEWIHGTVGRSSGAIRTSTRLGGIFNFYHREAA